MLKNPRFNPFKKWIEIRRNNITILQCKTLKYMVFSPDIFVHSSPKKSASQIPERIGSNT